MKKLQHKTGTIQDATAEKILKTCARLKEIILLAETDLPELPADFEQRGILLYESGLGAEGPAFLPGGEGLALMSELVASIKAYNQKCKDVNDQVPLDYPLFEATADNIGGYSNMAALNNLTQIQLFLQVAQTVRS